MQDDPSPSPGLPLPSRSLVWSTLKAVAAIAVISVAAAQFLSGSRLDRSSMNRLVAGVSDPVTTGSIASANGLRLDPCAVERRR